MTGSTFAAKAFTTSLSPFSAYFREQILGPLVGANLLLGVSLVEILRVRSDQILDHELMLGVELFRHRP